MAKKPKIVAATGTLVGRHFGGDAKRIEAAMVKAIEDNPRKANETQEQHDKRLREEIRKARNGALEG